MHRLSPTEIVDNFVQKSGTRRPDAASARVGIVLVTGGAVKIIMKSIACYAHCGSTPVAWLGVTLGHRMWNSVGSVGAKDA